MQQAGIDQLFQSAFHKLLKVTRNYYLLEISASLLRLVFYCGILLLGFAIIDVLFHLTVLLRVGFWVIAGALLVYFLIKNIIPGIKCAFWPGQTEMYQISKKIGKNDPEVQDSLVNFFQIYQEQGIAIYPPFKNLSLKQLYEKFRHSNFYKIISLRVLQKPANRLLIAGAVFLLMFFVFPVSMSQAVLKVLHPTKSFEKPLPISLQNLSGTLTVLKNEAVQLKGAYEGVAPDKLWLIVKSEPVSGDTAAIERLELSGSSGKNFIYEIPHVKNSFSYWFEANIEMSAFQNRPAVSQAGRVQVKDRPFVRELQAKLVYPQYTRLPSALLSPNNGEVTAILGTRVELDIVANKRLANAWLRFQDSTQVSLEVSENKARGHFVVEKDDQYQIVVLDSDSISNYQPVTYSVFALNDEKPYVEFARPGQDLDLGDNMEVPLLLNMRDDFGFNRLQLKGRHIHSGSTGDTSEIKFSLPIQILDQNRAISEYSWDMTSLYLIPDDYVEYYAEIWDNDRISGPKSTRSKSFVIRVPSLIDVLENTGEDITEQMKDTRDVSRETRELKEKLEEINREMKRENELSWERKKEIQEQVQKQKQSMEKLDDIQKELEDMVNKLDDRNMLSRETLEKFFELQKMFQDIASPELKEAMKKLQEALEKSDMNELKKAMEQFNLSMEEFEQRVERTYELFKRIELEQKMDELAKMAEKLAEEQEEINKQLEKENLSESQKEQLANKEGNLEKNTEFFGEKLEQAKEEFQKMMAELASDLEKAKKYFDEQQISEQMQQMKQQMQQGDMKQAKQSGKDLERQLEMMQSMMQQAQQNMTQMQKQELMQAMQKVQQDMLRSSFEQEQLLEKSKETDVASPQITDIARKQAQMRENSTQIIKQMIAISQKTFFVSPEMSQILSSLMQNMGNALQGLENRNPRSAAQSQQKAMSNFNQAIMSMQNSMNQLMQSGSASGFEQFMEQLQQMAGQQGQLNQETMNMFQMQQGNQGRMQLSEEAMGRLAAQQEMIRRSLENLNRQSGDRGDVLGRLGELGEDMEKVIDDLKKQKLDPKVIERQERILSRMLDAQKSVREREYSKKRQAEREENVVTKSPPELRRELLERENKLRKEMLDALKEGYSSEYKEFIKSYYEILSRQPGVNP